MRALAERGGVDEGHGSGVRAQSDPFGRSVKHARVRVGVGNIVHDLWLEGDWSAWQVREARSASLGHVVEVAAAVASLDPRTSGWEELGGKS